MALESTKPVAEVWYSVEACDHDILRFHESHIDPYAGWTCIGSRSGHSARTSVVIPPRAL